MSFTEQPNEILDMLLNTETIPLPQRLRLRAVSRRWLPVLEDGLARENTLVIRDVDVYYLESKPDHLVLPGGILTEEFIRTLVRLFPSPTELTLAFGLYKPSVSWSTVPTLLAQLGTNLTCVKLYGNLGEAVAEPLARALTNISTLTSLSLEDYGISEILLPYLGPVLSRLEAFFCAFTPTFASLIASSLSPRCTRLRLDEQVFAAFPGPVHAQLSASLVHLSLMYCDDTVSESLWQMRALISLGLQFSDGVSKVLDSSLLRPFVPFARLTDLKLFNVLFYTSLALPFKMEKPLSTIQRLTLEVEFDDDPPIDYDAFFKFIGAWFPFLSHLTLIVNEGTRLAIQDSLGKLPFSVKTVDRRHFDHILHSDF